MPLFYVQNSFMYIQAVKFILLQDRKTPNSGRKLRFLHGQYLENRVFYWQTVTSRKLKGPTAQGLICKQTALRTEHDSIAKIEEIENKHTVVKVSPLSIKMY